MVPGASRLQVPHAIDELISEEVGEADRRKLAALLTVWDSRVLTLLGGGGLRRFHELDQGERERVLLSWCDSRVRDRRAAFQALRRAVTPLAYILPGLPDPNPRWGAIGYPGPLARIDPAPPKAISPLPVDRPTTLDCDVCVVGSGAGGGTAAGVLAAAGLDVVVLEAGGYYDDADFDGSELDGYSRLYLGKAAVATDDQGVGLLAGACLGGGTVVNFSTSFRTPEAIRTEWADFGVPVFASPDYGHSLDAVWERLGVNTDQSRPSSRELIMKLGLEELGWHVGVIPRNVRGCDQATTCGYGGFGCQLGSKQSTTKTWLADAYERGARMLVGTRAERVIVSQGRARGVTARTTAGHPVTVRARSVVVAAGALHTPVLLRRSGLENANIGRYLRLHPATGVAGVFDAEVRPWEGTMQAIYSDQFSDLERGYGFKFESAPLHPSVLAMYAPWRGARPHAEIMHSLPHVAPVGVLLRDSTAGEVRVGRGGKPVVRYRMNELDKRHLRTGVEGAARLLEAAGARRIFSAHAKEVAYEPGRRGNLKRFMDDADACGWGAGQCVATSFHIQGSARMGPSPEESACNPEGETWEVRDLHVYDGSTFPTAVGVNPMITIEAIAHVLATRLAQSLS